MKLKYDKTGEYGKLVFRKDGDRYAFYIEATGSRFYYHSFAQMVKAGWEVCREPNEPLIKDEKIRKAVRAWAEITGLSKYLLCIKHGSRLEISDGSPSFIYISFRTDMDTLNNIENRTYYTLTVLCGEE